MEFKSPGKTTGNFTKGTFTPPNRGGTTPGAAAGDLAARVAVLEEQVAKLLGVIKVLQNGEKVRILADHIELAGNQKIEVAAGMDLKISAGLKTEIKGMTVGIQASTELTAEAGTICKVKGGPLLTLRGGTVKVNDGARGVARIADTTSGSPTSQIINSGNITFLA